MTVAEEFNRPALQKLYSVAGRLLFVESHNAALGQKIEQLFAGWLLNPVSYSNKSPAVQLTFISQTQIPSIPRNLDQFDIADGGRGHTDGELFFLDAANSLMSVENDDPPNVTVW